MLQAIQKDQMKILYKHAKNLFPTHPLLRDLYKLLATDAAPLGKEKTKMTLAGQLEPHLPSLIKKYPEEIKTAMLSVEDTTAVAQRLTHYFSSQGVNQFMHLFGNKPYVFVRKYIDFALQLGLQGIAQEIDAPTWRRYNEAASLTYLLNLGNDAFDKTAFLKFCLKALTNISKKTLNDIMQCITAAPIAHEKTSNGDVVPISEEIIMLVKALQKTEKHDSLGFVEDREAPVPAVKEEDTQAPQAQEAPPEEIKVYIQNAGIIFLWPFFKKLFEDKGLMEEGVFIDEITLNNAVHMLQYLVTEKLSTSEEALVLNKIFCGLNHDDVVTPNYILREEDQETAIDNREEKDQAPKKTNESASSKVPDTSIDVKKEQKIPDNDAPGKSQDNESAQPIEENEWPAEIIRLKNLCQAVLTQAIKKWESLKTLEEYEAYKEGFTIADFKDYILKRHGILQKIEQEETHYWHLGLAVKSYDEKELKPPWPISPIRLPWMQEELVVFWLPE